MVMLQKSPVSPREHGHVMEVVSLIEVANLMEVAILMEGEWSC